MEGLPRDLGGYSQDLARRVNPMRAHILDAAVKHEFLEVRDDGYLYPADGVSHRFLFTFLSAGWWTRTGREWRKAGRALKRELKEDGRINPRDFGL